MMFDTMSEAIAAYDDMLDEYYPDQIGGIPASRILREVDPIAYRCDFHDWLDGHGLSVDDLEDDADLP